MSTFFILVLIIETLLFIAAIIAIIKMSKKIDKYEKMINEYYKISDQVIDWLKIAINKLHDIDRRQIFESDDDVGWFFKSLKYIITELNNNVAKIFGETTDAEKKEEN